MKIQAYEIPHLRLTGSIAAILLGILVIMAVMGVLPYTDDEAVTALARDKTPTAGFSRRGGADTPGAAPPLKGKTRGRIWAECEECGYIMSKEKIVRNGAESGAMAIAGLAGNNRSGIRDEDTPNDAMTVRLKDGSNRVFMDSHPANWLPGERVIFIEGARRTTD